MGWKMRNTAWFLLLTFASSAVAVSDPASDRIGIYFDTSGDYRETQAAPSVPVRAYVIVTNPTFPVLYGWEAAINGISPHFYLLESNISNGEENSSTFPEFKVGFSTPLVTETATVLADFLFLMAIYGTSCLSLSGISDPALSGELPLVWKSEDQPTPIEPSLRFVNGVVATINDTPVLIDPTHCQQVVSTVTTSWGSIKSVYR